MVAHCRPLLMKFSDSGRWAAWPLRLSRYHGCQWLQLVHYRWRASDARQTLLGCFSQLQDPSSTAGLPEVEPARCVANSATQIRTDLDVMATPCSSAASAAASAFVGTCSSRHNVLRTYLAPACGWLVVLRQTIQWHSHLQLEAGAAPPWQGQCSCSLGCWARHGERPMAEEALACQSLHSTAVATKVPAQEQRLGAADC
mmetsp:Transcript_5260/g.9418  ORF Transcript_5260/g.9418 Transcript_5260/m.9418 type:complete len:200 (-) Transcript_5260:1589-2188(-)